MRILVVSNTPWSDDNSFGNSFSNIFQGMDDFEFANIYLRPGKPHNKLKIRYFQITERTLIENLLHSSKPSGKEVLADKETGADEKYIAGWKFSAKKRLQVLFWLRDLIWKLGRWDSPQLRHFIDDFKPDLLFQPVYYSNYILDIAEFVKAYTNRPMLGYISDDNYTLRQLRFSPLYWIDRFHKRKKVEALIEKCRILYVISEIQRREYQRIFSPECKILTKCGCFDGETPFYNNLYDEITLNYSGGIGDSRYKSLSIASKAVEAFRKDGRRVRLDIYTGTPLTSKMRKALNHEGTYIHGAVPYQVIRAVQREADVLLHVEGLDLSSRLSVHQSFSTKIVDYLEMGKCILAIGPHDVASVQYLADNEAAIIASNSSEVADKLREILDNSCIINEMGKKAFECGKKNHDKKKIQSMIRADFYEQQEYKSN